MEIQSTKKVIINWWYEILTVEERREYTSSKCRYPAEMQP